MKELLVLAKDRIGLLADLSYILGEAGINIESISADTLGDKAVIRLIVSDDKLGEKVLEKGDFIVMSSDAIVIKVMDKPGELSKVARKLANAKISIKTLRVDNAKKAANLLKEYM